MLLINIGADASSSDEEERLGRWVKVSALWGADGDNWCLQLRSRTCKIESSWTPNAYAIQLHTFHHEPRTESTPRASFSILGFENSCMGQRFEEGWEFRLTRKEEWAESGSRIVKEPVRRDMFPLSIRPQIQVVARQRQVLHS
jgi:hypothetical protein